MNCFIDDQFGLQNLDAIGEDMVAYECDYPHSDCLWPEAPEFLWQSVKHLTDAQIDKVTHVNAMRWFNFDLFDYHKREELTVGVRRRRPPELTPRRVLPAGRRRWRWVRSGA
jgi:hypothetical protein